MAKLGCPSLGSESFAQIGIVKRIAVVGAGWAGLTAALSLQRLGHTVTLYERSPAHQGAGGRASTAYTAGERAPFAIDNGQHVMLGAYRDALALFKTLGINTEHAFLRLPATWFVPGQLDIAIASWVDKNSKLWNAGFLKQIPIALALFKSSPFMYWPALLLAAIRLQLGHPSSDESVTQWLARLKFPPLFIEHLWLPLCYATLNTPPSSASATVFKRVINDGLLTGSRAAAMLVPRSDLGSLFPQEALAELSRHHATLKLGFGVERIEIRDGAIAIYADHAVHEYDAVVCATSAKDAARVLPANCISVSLQTLATQAPEPITTIHLNVGVSVHLPKPVCVLPEPLENTHPIQHAVVIDRSTLQLSQNGWLTVVLSCSGLALTHGHDELIQSALNRLKECFPDLALPSRCEGLVIHAKQATFACTAGLLRPSIATTDPRIVLAGDYVAGDYPATLEGAVRSGLKAAALLND